MYCRTLPRLGSRPPRRVPNPPFLHASQRPAEEAQVDFAALNLKYPVDNPTFAIPKIGWSPKPADSPKLPFFVERTDGQALPVYTDYKGGRTKVITILRKIKGDVNELKLEVEKVVGKNVEVRAGKLVVVGNYHLRLKLWLIGLGF
jgi:large subunit ribosomal protein L49